MENFITYDMLTTWVTFVSIILGVTQFIKEISIFKKVPTKYLSFMIAFILLIFTNVSTGVFNFMDIPLYILSSMFAGMNANGVYDFTVKKTVAATESTTQTVIEKTNKTPAPVESTSTSNI